jgi:type 1 fimbria pilin
MSVFSFFCFSGRVPAQCSKACFSMLCKVFLYLIFFLYAENAAAFECEYRGNYVDNNGSTNLRLDVELAPEIHGGINELVKFNEVFCANTAPGSGITDTLYLNNLDFRGGLTGAGAGAIVKGVKYIPPFASRIHLVTLGPGERKSLPVSLFVDVGDTPSETLKIKKGELFAIFRMKQDSSQDAGQYFNFNFYALNDVGVVTNTCDVNGGEQIDVDFGQVDKYLLTNDTNSAVKSVEVPLSIRCSQSAFTGPVGIELLATPASFNPDFIQTTLGSDKNKIGVAMLDASRNVVRPGRKLTSYISNGFGSTSVSFVPVKNSTITNDQLPVGAFSASATLVVSTP